jgi:long-chain fatty acid transport protein
VFTPPALITSLTSTLRLIIPLSFALVWMTPLPPTALTSTLGQADAAGLEIPGAGTEAAARGGASVTGVTNPTAAFLNPGVLSRLKGLRLTYNHSLMWSRVSFARAESVIPRTLDIEGGTALAENQKPLFPLNGLLAISHDFNTPVTFALSIHGPNGSGASKYDIQNGQRYMITELNGLIAFIGLSAGYGGRDWGVGATLQYATMPSMNYRMVVDGTSLSDLNPYLSDLDVEAELDVSDMASYSAIIGGWYRPTPSIELGLSGRVLPVVFNAKGDVTLHDTPNAKYGDGLLDITDGSAAFDLTLPPTARFGVRYRHLIDQRELFDVEIALVYEGWSTMDAFAVDLEGSTQQFGPLNDVTLDKKWRDTLSARLGGTWRFNDDLSLSAGTFWEQGSTPDTYAHLDFPSFDRFGVAGGLSYALGARLSLSLAYLHVFESSVTVDERYGKVFQQRPILACDGGACGTNSEGDAYTGVPINAGVFKASFQNMSIGINAQF